MFERMEETCSRPQGPTGLADDLCRVEVRRCPGGSSDIVFEPHGANRSKRLGLNGPVRAMGVFIVMIGGVGGVDCVGLVAGHTSLAGSVHLPDPDQGRE